MAKLSSATHAAIFAHDKYEIAKILNGDKKEREKKIAVYNYVLHGEALAGSSYVVTIPDRNPYIILGMSSEAILLPKHGRGADSFFAYLEIRYGLSEREKITQLVYDNVRLYAYQQGAEVELRRFAYFNKYEEALYLSRYNGYAFRISGETEIKTVKNGEGVYFADDDFGVACDSEVVISPNGILFDTLTNPNFAIETPSGITPEQQRRAIIVWMFAVALPDLMPTKPLILFEGVPGSGKTACTQCIQLALLGNKKSMIISRNKENDFGVLLLRSPIALIDNMDNYISWIPDAVAAYATSGVWPSRKLYTDDAEVVIKPQSFIAIASKNPASFRAEDVAERTIIIRLARRDGFTRQEKIEAAIRNNRGRLLGEYIYYLNEIVKVIKTGELDRGDEGGEQHRMADFAALARVVAKVLEWKAEEVPEGMEDGPAAAVVELLGALQAERDAFVNEEDPLSDLLNRWLEVFNPAYDGKPARRPNIGRTITTQDLFSELDKIAKLSDIQFYKSVRQLSQKLRSPHLTREFVVVSTTVRNTRAYQISKKSALSLVSGSNDGSPQPTQPSASVRPFIVVSDDEGLNVAVDEEETA